MSDAADYQLTAIDIIDLRVKMGRNFISDGTGGRYGAPFVTFAMASKEYILHAGGVTVAVSTRPELIAACLRNERIEAGYCRRILSATEPPDVAAMTPEERYDRQLKVSENAAKARAYLRDQEASSAERHRMAKTTPADYADLSLDDLI